MRPRLLIADEPTTALDVTIQRQILAVVNELRRDLDMATIWVTHDLGVVAQLVERVVVMYGGFVVEEAPVDRLFHAPAAPIHQRAAGGAPRPPRTTPGRRSPRSRAGRRSPPSASRAARSGPAARRPATCARCGRRWRSAGDGRVACWVPPEEWTAA